MGRQSALDKVGDNNVYFDALTTLSGGDESREPPAGWSGTVRDVASWFGVSVVQALQAMHFSESEVRELGETWDSLADNLTVDVSPPPAPKNHHGDLKQVPQWRVDAAHAIDPRTTQDLLG